MSPPDRYKVPDWEVLEGSLSSNISDIVPSRLQTKRSGGSARGDRSPQQWGEQSSRRRRRSVAGNSNSCRTMDAVCAEVYRGVSVPADWNMSSGSSVRHVAGNRIPRLWSRRLIEKASLHLVILCHHKLVLKTELIRSFSSRNRAIAYLNTTSSISSASTRLLTVIGLRWIESTRKLFPDTASFYPIKSNRQPCLINWYWLINITQTYSKQRNRRVVCLLFL